MDYPHFAAFDIDNRHSRGSHLGEKGGEKRSGRFLKSAIACLLITAHGIRHNNVVLASRRGRARPSALRNLSDGSSVRKESEINR